MNHLFIPTLLTDLDFKILIQPKTDSFYQKLENAMLKNGCSSPIEIWQGYIVDGHNRYEICQKQKLSFRIKELPFLEKNEIFSYLCDIQLKRDDLTPEYKKYLLGRRLHADIALATEKHIKAHPEHKLYSNGKISQKYIQKTEIAVIIGKQYNFHSSTIIKYNYYSNAIDAIRAVDPETAQMLLMGKPHISHENTIELARLPRKSLCNFKKLLEETKHKPMKYSQIRYELLQKKRPAKPPIQQMKKPQQVKIQAKIKQMPALDPNAELSSLTLTIPSWVRTIKRSIEFTDFPSTSIKTRNALIVQLTDLSQKINILLKQLKEVTENDK